MKISWIIPTYGEKGIKLVEQCINSLQKYHLIDEIIVIDDGSSIEIQDQLFMLSCSLNFKLLTSFHNLGYSHTINRGIEQAKGDIIVTVNNDIIFTQKLDFSMFDRDPALGIIGFLLYYPNGNIQHGGFLRFPKTTNFGHVDHNHTPQQAKEAYISRYNIGVTGAIQAIRKQMTNKIGIYSTKYMNCYEDVEFCLRSWKHGWHIWYDGQQSAIHAEGATRGQTITQKKAVNMFESELLSLIQFHKDVDKFDIEDIERLIKILNTNVPKRKKIGLIRTWALGDAILVTGIIDKLAKDNDVYFCTDPSLVHVFNNNPNIKRIFTDIDRLNAFCDEVIDLSLVYENNPKKPIWKAYADHAFKDGYFEDDILPKMYSNHIDKANVIIKLKELNITDFNDIILVHAPKSWPSRTLDAGTWRDVIDKLIITYKILFVGTEKDMSFYNGITYDFRDHFTIPELRELMQMSKFFIGTDSSLLHLAQTTDTQTIGIFSCVNPEYRIFNKKTRVVIPNSDCKFCLQDAETTIKLECKHGDNRCINSIEAINVLKEVY